MIFLRYTPFHHELNGTLYCEIPKQSFWDLGSYVIVEMFREFPFLLFRYKFLLKKNHTPWFCWVLKKKKKAISELWPHFGGKQVEVFSLKHGSSSNQRMAPGQKLGYHHCSHLGSVVMSGIIPELRFMSYNSR